MVGASAIAYTHVLGRPIMAIALQRRVSRPLPIISLAPAVTNGAATGDAASVIGPQACLRSQCRHVDLFGRPKLGLHCSHLGNKLCKLFWTTSRGIFASGIAHTQSSKPSPSAVPVFIRRRSRSPLPTFFILARRKVCHQIGGDQRGARSDASPQVAIRC